MCWLSPLCEKVRALQWGDQWCWGNSQPQPQLKVCETPWKEARLGLVKYNLLTEPLSFPLLPTQLGLGFLLVASVALGSADSLCFTNTACYEFKTLKNLKISPKSKNLQLLLAGRKSWPFWG